MKFLALLGIYDIWVHKGAVSVYGAVLRTGPRLHRICASMTHAIPTLSIIRDPYGPYSQSAVITIFSCRTGVQFLRWLFTGFDRSWILPKVQSSGPNFRKDNSLYRTFQPVRHPLR